MNTIKTFEGFLKSSCGAPHGHRRNVRPEQIVVKVGKY